MLRSETEVACSGNYRNLLGFDCPHLQSSFNSSPTPSCFSGNWPFVEVAAFFAAFGSSILGSLVTSFDGLPTFHVDQFSTKSLLWYFAAHTVIMTLQTHQHFSFNSTINKHHNQFPFPPFRFVFSLKFLLLRLLSSKRNFIIAACVNKFE